MINVFQVGVHIGMTSNASQVLSSILSHLMGVHVAANRVQGALGSIRTAALGAGAVFAGWSVVKGLLDATKHAEKLNHELVKLQTGARLTDAQTDQARVLAFKVSRDVAGTDVAENVKQQRELFGVVGDMEEARKLLPLIATGSRAVSNYVDKDTDLAQIAIRTLEMRGQISKDGKIDPEKFRAEFSSLVRSIVASEGLIDQQKLYMATKQAGPAARTMNADEYFGKFPAIINAMGAGPAGTALNSFFKQFVGHTVGGLKVAEAMEDAGMLTKGKWRVDKRTHKVEIDKDAVPDQAGAMDHPITWLHEKLEALRKQKDRHGKPLDLLAVVQDIFQLSSRATTGRFINDVDANYATIANEEQRYKRTPSPDVIAKEQNEKDLSVNIHNLTEAWNNFLAALGGPGIPVAITVLHGLTGALNVMQEAIIRHPTIAADLFYLAGAIGGLTALGGGLVILNAAWAPLAAGLSLLTGITGLAAAAAGITAVATGLTALGAAVTGLPPLLKWLADQALGTTPHGPATAGGRGSVHTTPDGILAPSANPQHGQPEAPPMEVLPGVSRGGGRGSSHGTSPYVAPPPAVRPERQSLILNLDGRRLASILLDHAADGLARPPTGQSSPDIRVSPLMPGQLPALA